MNTGKTLFAQLMDVLAQDAKLYHMGFREPIRRSTLADANKSRDWRIHADVAQRLIGEARALYASEDLGLDLSNTVYALDSTTIDLCLSVFPWTHFCTTKAIVKMHLRKMVKTGLDRAQPSICTTGRQAMELVLSNKFSTLKAVCV